MEKFADIKLQSYSIKKEYYPEKDYVKCPNCPNLLHCSYCVQHLRNQNPHHWVGITVDEVPGCRGCRERYQRGIAEAKNEAILLRMKLNILETGLTSYAEDLKDAHELADVKLAAQQLADETSESVMEMDFSAQMEDLSKSNEDAESIVGMKLRLELEKMKEAVERADSRVTFLKRRPPDSAAPGTPGGSLGSTLPIVGDVTFVVQGQNIFAHQLILGYKSSVFQKIFEHLHPELPPKIPQTLTQVERASIPPIPPPPPPPPAPPLPPPQDTSPKIIAEKPPKMSYRVHPVVKVRLVSSSMLEQMGLRGVRCHLTVVMGEDSTSETSVSPRVSQLIQDYPAKNSNVDDGRKTEITSNDCGQGLQSGGTVSRTSIISAPLVFPETVNSIQPQILVPEAAQQPASVLAPAISLPIILECPVPEKENNQRGGHAMNDLAKFSEQEGPMGVFQNVQSAYPADAKALIEVNDISYEVMRAVINCFYTADMNFTEEVPPGEVLKVAHKYQIDYLRDLCEQELCQRLNSGNVAEMLKLARKLGAKKLHAQATQLFKDNFDDVQETVLNNCC